MRTKRIRASDPRMKAAIEEMKSRILQAYPGTNIDVEEGDDPQGIYLWANVDPEDSVDLMDLIIGRVVDLQVDEGLPLYVVPGQSIWSAWREEQKAKKASGP